MSEKLKKELEFWEHIYNAQGDQWLEYRKRVAKDIISKFPEPFLSDMLNSYCTVLEIGTGLVPPLYFWLDGNHFTLVAIDPLAREYAHIDPTGAQFYVVASAENIPYPDESFEYIVCMNALDHMDDADKALDEMYRVLFTGNYLFLQVHCGTQIGGPHTYSFNKDTLQEIVEKHGFKIVSVRSPVKADGLDAIYMVATK